MHSEAKTVLQSPESDGQSRQTSALTTAVSQARTKRKLTWIERALVFHVLFKDRDTVSPLINYCFLNDFSPKIRGYRSSPLRGL
jgi:hypothetical protein